MRGYGYRPLSRLHPQRDWVELDPEVVAGDVAAAISEAIEQAGCRPAEIVACGIDCQRNTDFAWDVYTGRPVAPAISWQDLRTVSMQDEISGWTLADQYRRRLGYFPGPYSSALHLAWRMRYDARIREAARAGTLRLGLSAAWLLVALGQPSGHYMDHSLVQAMGLYDFRAERYWDAWLDFLGVPQAPLPLARPTLYDFGVLRTVARSGAEAEAPVLAMIGDQQAALFGYDCRQAGDAECTHGTASFVDVCMGERAPEQDNLNVYFAWNLGSAHTYCLEADTTVTGAVVRWMRESAQLLERESDIGPLAASVPDSGGVVFIPAFTGLNVPYQEREARGTILGMTLGTTRAHLARAFLEAIGYQIRAILETIMDDTGLRVTRLHVGGGLAASDEACQIQADLTGIPVIRPNFTETTARAAALLAGLGAGVWKDVDNLPPLPGEQSVFTPRLSQDQRDAGYEHWSRAVSIARSWRPGAAALAPR